MAALMKRNGTLNMLPGLSSLFHDPFKKDWLNWPDEIRNEHSTLPAVNIHETADAYELAVAAPGMDRNDFKVELDNNLLVISGEKKEEKNNKDESYIRQEYNYQSFTRTFSLAEREVHADKIQAKYSDGILYITIPKTAEAKAKAPRVIPIS